jgi:hypothetical protein
MNIKPPGGTPLPGGFPNTPETSAAGKPFRAPADAETIAENLQSAQTSGIATQFTLADLSDPQTLDKAVRQVVGGLVQNEWGSRAGLSENDQKNLVDFMAADPTMRNQVERWLHKVVK